MDQPAPFRKDTGVEPMRGDLTGRKTASCRNDTAFMSGGFILVAMALLAAVGLGIAIFAWKAG